LPDRLERGRQALDVMERHPATQPFFVGGCYSIADIALYAYTHVADQRGHDLTRSRRCAPGWRAWLPRRTTCP
jgi:glutathione S-transferase